MLWERVTNSRVISPTPLWVFSLTLVSNGSGAADVTLYNGESADEGQVIKLLAADGELTHLTFPEPLYLDRGLQVTVGSNVNELLVHYTTERE